MNGTAAELRVALIGFGHGGSLHAPLIAVTPGLRLTSVVTSSPERAARVEAEHPEARVLGSAAELWEQAEAHDIVVITTPNESHVELAMAALERRLATVIDKPIATSAADGRLIVERARKLEVPLSVFQNRRWDSEFLTLSRLLESGELGAVHRFESRFERWRPHIETPGWRLRTPRDRGGGVLLDLGSHLVDQALRLFGPAAGVRGHSRRLRGFAGDDDAFIVVEHESGTESLIWVSEMAAAPGPRMRALGERGAFEIEALDDQDETLSAGGTDGRGPGGEEPRERGGLLRRGEEENPVQAEPGDWARFYGLLGEALREGGPMPVDPLDAVRVLELLEQVPELPPQAG